MFAAVVETVTWPGMVAKQLLRGRSASLRDYGFDDLSDSRSLQANTEQSAQSAQSAGLLDAEMWSTHLHYLDPFEAWNPQTGASLGTGWNPQNIEMLINVKSVIVNPLPQKKFSSPLNTRNPLRR